MRIVLPAMLVLAGLSAGCGAAPQESQGDEPAQQQQSARQRESANAQPAASTPQPARGAYDPKTGIDWANFLGPNRDSKSPEQGVTLRWSAQGPPATWVRTLGVGYGMPSFVDGKMYTFARFGDRARLVASQIDSGKELWRFEYPTHYTDLLGYNNGPRCQPVVDGDRVYIFGAEGMLHCINAATGEALWKVDTTAKYKVVKNFFGVGSTPIIEGDLLIVNVGGSPPGQPADVYAANGEVESNGTGIVAFDKKSGEEKYRITKELASYASPVCTTIDDRRWCFVFARGGLVGFEPAAGKVDFEFPWRSAKLESVNASTPIVVGDQVFISETYSEGSALLKVKPGGHEVVWDDSDKGRDKSLMTHWNTPIHIDGYVYGCSGRHSQSADLRCIELKSGKVMWTQRLIDVDGEQEPLARSSLLWVDGHFICLTEYGSLFTFKVNPEAFELVSSCTPKVEQQGAKLPDFTAPRLLQYPAWAAPVVSQGKLYVRGKDRLVSYDLRGSKK